MSYGNSPVPSHFLPKTNSPFPIFSESYYRNFEVEDAVIDRLMQAQTLFAKLPPIGEMGGKELDEGLMSELNAMKEVFLSQELAPSGEGIYELVAKCTLSSEAKSKDNAVLVPSQQNSTGTSTSAKIEEVKGDEGTTERYTREERWVRIAKYKEKLRKRRARRPVSRLYEGRRRIAFSKQRLNGKFAKMS